MKFTHANRISLIEKDAYMLIPFFEETRIDDQLLEIEGLQASDSKVVDLRRRVEGQKNRDIHSVVLATKSGSLSLKWMDLGSVLDFQPNHFMDVFSKFGKELKEDYTILLDGLAGGQFSVEQLTELIVKGMYRGAYTFSKEGLKNVTSQGIFGVREGLRDEKSKRTITLISGKDLEGPINKATDFGQCINHARTLGDMPANYLHTRQLSHYLEDFSKHYKLSCDTLRDEALEALHCGGILGVNAGCDEEANLISVYYEGNKGGPVTALIGKGVMFDSGGYHIKSISGMEGMKYDMCGAANMIAALEIAVRQKSKENILLVIPAVENLINSKACKMGDVLVTMSGKTVEVYNTDAEGRLILCDAITYAISKGANRLIDLATLTYSCQNALGDEVSGIFSNNEMFYNHFLTKAKEQAEKVWRLPLDEAYRKPLYRTQTADLINYAPGSYAGASVAASFLEAFVDKEIPWIHLDVVGTAVHRSDDLTQSYGATGVMTASIAALFL